MICMGSLEKLMCLLFQDKADYRETLSLLTDHVFSREFAYTDRSDASAKAHSNSAKIDEFIFPGNVHVLLFQEKCLLVSDN